MGLKVCKRPKKLLIANTLRLETDQAMGYAHMFAVAEDRRDTWAVTSCNVPPDPPPPLSLPTSYE